MHFLALLFIIIAAHHACDSPPDFSVAPPAAKAPAELEELYEQFLALPERGRITEEECAKFDGQWSPEGCSISGPTRSEEEAVEVVEQVEVEEARRGRSG